MSWQKQEQCWTKDLWQKATAETMQQEREEVYAALQYAAGLHCLVEEWKDCEELRPKPKEKWVFVEKEERECEASNRVVCGSRQVSMYEMGERKQTYEDARKMHMTEILVKEFGKWRRRHLGGHDLVRTVDRRRKVLIWCRKCSGYARQRMGPKLMNCCKPEPMGTQV